MFYHPNKTTILHVLHEIKMCKLHDGRGGMGGVSQYLLDLARGSLGCQCVSGRRSAVAEKYLKVVPNVNTKREIVLKCDV